MSDGGRATIALVTDGTEIVRVPASGFRSDVGQVHPALGPDRGFAGEPRMSPGRRLVCAWGEGAGIISALLGCTWFDNPPYEPFGNVSGASPLFGGVRVTGWTLDREVTDPVTARFYVNGRFGGDRLADQPRPDVAGVYPAYGPNHGFAASLGTGPGRHTVCVNGVNVGAGSTEGFLGCVVAAAQTGPPIGNFEQLTAGPGSATVSGWTFDPDDTRATSVHVYVDGAYAGSFPASNARPDLAGPYPFMGTDHGFRATVGGLAPGRHTVCVYAINVGPAAGNPLLGCSALG